MFALKSTAKLPFFSHSAKFPVHFFRIFFLHFAIVLILGIKEEGKHSGNDWSCGRFLAHSGGYFVYLQMKMQWGRHEG